MTATTTVICPHAVTHLTLTLNRKADIRDGDFRRGVQTTAGEGECPVMEPASQPARQPTMAFTFDLGRVKRVQCTVVAHRSYPAKTPRHGTPKKAFTLRDPVMTTAQ